ATYTGGAGARADRGQCQARRDQRQDVPLGSRAVAQLTPAVEAPAERRACRRDAAGVTETCAQRDEREARADWCRNQPTGSCAVPQLAAGVEPPAVRSAGLSHA